MKSNMNFEDAVKAGFEGTRGVLLKLIDRLEAVEIRLEKLEEVKNENN